MWSNLKRNVVPTLNHAWQQDDDEDDASDDEEDSIDDHDRIDGAPQAPPPPPAVGNLLMGRLTRFIEQVARPDDDDDDQAMGWNDNSESAGSLGLGDGWEPDEDGMMQDVDGDVNMAEETTPEEWHGDGAQYRSDVTMSSSSQDWPMEQPPMVEEEPPDAWQDDDELDLSDHPPPAAAATQAPPAPAPEPADAWRDDDELDFSDTEPPIAEPPSEAMPPPVEDDAWPEEDGLDVIDSPLEEIEPSPPSYVTKVQQNLQTVLNEIDEQERAARPSRVDSSQDGLSIGDAEHADQAVEEIRHEIEGLDTSRTEQQGMTVIVDQTPPVSPLRQTPSSLIGAPPPRIGSQLGSASMAVLAETEDLTRDTGVDTETERVFDDENEIEFLPVVDHTPSKSKEAQAVPLSRQNSLAVQQPQDENLTVEDGWGDEMDDELDLSVRGDDDDDASSKPPPESSAPPPPAVVDQLPHERARTTDRDLSVGVLLSEEDSTHVDADEDDQEEYGPVVDHTPKQPPLSGVFSVAFSGTNSLAVQATGLGEDFQLDEDMDETCYGDSTVGGPTGGTSSGGWDQDDVDLDSVDEDEQEAAQGNRPLQRKPTSETQSENKHVVDHTPQEMADQALVTVITDPSVAVLATQDDLTRDTGLGEDEDVYDDENEVEYGPVVDHTPPTPAASVLSRGLSGTNSMVVHASDLQSEIEEDDAMDETTAYGDSTVGAGEGWEQDDDILATESQDGSKRPSVRIETIREDRVALVDHTPSEMGPPTAKLVDPSVEVLPSVATSKDGDNDSTGGQVEYGPVVDQTPTTPAHSGILRSDSVVVQAHDLDTVDETYGDEDDASEDDTFNSELPTVLRATEDKLVDQIPMRPESRFGDASTMVAADPSEVLSEVDDMAQEEVNFGPVVDLLPPSRPGTVSAGIPSAAGSTAAGSTAVFAPASVAADDLDGEEEESVANGEEEPNPQSGNDESLLAEEPMDQVNEQLVDFLPPPHEQRDMNNEASVQATRDGLSEWSVGGTQSALDPKEDDFGPVVDQTPVTHPAGLSHASTTTQLTASECRALAREDNAEGTSEDVEQDQSKVVVDKLPHLQLPLDSTASVGGSQLAEDEEDDSKFGPVVDHLPTPRASLAPSRGGSTVDALGTVSEVNSDVDDGGDTWDDDGDIDISESGVSEGTGLQPAVATRMSFRRPDQDRNVSVRFQSVDDGLESSQDTSNRLGQTQFYDPESGTSLAVDETRYYDPVGNEGSGWGDDVELAMSPRVAHGVHLSDKSFAEADTPPSTPYRRSEAPIFHSPLNLKPRSEKADGCESCREAKTTECPCIQKLLTVNQESGALFGTLITPEGETVQVNFSKLLEDEIARRRLLEEESKALQSTMDAKRLEESLVSAKSSELESEVEELQLSKSHLERELESMRETNLSLIEERAKMTEDLQSSQIALTDNARNESSWAVRESALEAEIQSLKDALAESAAQSSSDVGLATKLSDIQSALAFKTGECEELNAQIMQLQLRWENAEYDKEESKQQLKEVIGELERVRKDHDAKSLDHERLLLEARRSSAKLGEDSSKKLADLSSELHRLQKAKEELMQTVADLQTEHEADLQKQYSLLDKKSSEIRTLESTVQCLEGEKAKVLADLAQQRSLAEKSQSLAAELLSVAEERDLLHDALNESKEAVALLQKMVDEHGMEQAAVESRRDTEITELKAELIGAKNLLAEKESQMEKFSGEVEALREARDAAESALQDAVAACKSAESAAEAFGHNVVELEGKAADAMAKAEKLENALAQATADLEREQGERRKATTHLATLGRTLERKDKDIQANHAKLTELQALLGQAKDESSSLAAQLETAVALRHEAERKEATAKSQLDRAVSELQHARVELEQQITSMQELEHSRAHEFESLQAQSSALTSERDNWRARCSELESQVSRALAEADERVRVMSAQFEKQLDDLRSNERSLRNEVSRHQSSEQARARERDQLLAKCHELEAKAARAAQSSDGDKARVTQALDQKKRELQQMQAAKANVESELADATRELDETRQHVEGLVQERDAFVEENEELLVQLGLLKHQLDEAEEQNRTLQGEIEMLESLQDAGETHRNGNDRASELDSMSKEMAALSLRLQQADGERASLAEQVNSLQAEKEHFVWQIELLESGGAEERDQLQSTMQELESRCQQFEKECHSQKHEIQMLSNQLREVASEQGQASVTDALQAEWASKQKTIDDLTGQIRILQAQLAAVESELNASNASAAEKDSRIQELEELNEEAEDQLGFTRDQLTAAQASIKATANLSSFEAAIEDLEMNDTAAKAQDIIAEYDKRMKKLERELDAKKQQVLKLEESVSELQFHLEASQSQASLNFSMSQVGNMSLNAADKDSEVNALKAQLESLQAALQSTRSRLASKEEEVDRLSSETAKLQAEMAKSAASATNLLDQPADDVNDIENLRSHVISLAVALERSENRRAQAISRLLTERESSANSLRRLGESVKRYYSSVSHGDV